MARPLSIRDSEAFILFQHRNRFLTTIRKECLAYPQEQGEKVIFHHSCATLAEPLQCLRVWAGTLDCKEGGLPLLASTPSDAPLSASTSNFLKNITSKQFTNSPAVLTDPLILNFDREQSAQTEAMNCFCLVLPISYSYPVLDFIVLHCRKKINARSLKFEFITQLVDGAALALYSLETSLRLKFERDFNKDIVDTSQALIDKGQVGLVMEAGPYVLWNNLSGTIKR